MHKVYRALYVPPRVLALPPRLFAIFLMIVGIVTFVLHKYILLIPIVILYIVIATLLNKESEWPNIVEFLFKIDT